MCYRKKREGEQKPFSFFKELIPYVAELTDQCSIGGGEPFLHPKEVMELGEECKECCILMNVTTNGTQPMKPEYVKNVEMASISFDRYKRPKLKDMVKYENTVRNLSTRVGANLLIDTGMFKRKENFPMIVNWLFAIGVERVFALYPKNWVFVDILPHTDTYAALTKMHEHFYVDDLTSMILKSQHYGDWKEPCHYGKDLISINEFGEVTGCSFDGPEKAVLKLEKPEDILEIKNIKMEERHSCPYARGECDDVGGTCDDGKGSRTPAQRAGEAEVLLREL
jgi:hypothetical protein